MASPGNGKRIGVAASWASSPGVRRSMRSNRSRDTLPEVAVRSELHRAGLRFRTHFKVLPSVRGDVDVAFTRQRVAVFIDGCFWHGCPQHATRPATNGDWWRQKLDGNIARDIRTNAALATAGWTVLRFWEHSDPREVAAAVKTTLASCSPPRTLP